MINQAARSVKWTFLYNAAPRVVTPFSTIILAALLVPDDFGLFAISTFVTALARIIVDLGLSKAVVQRQTHVNEAASICFWLNLAISGCIYAILWIAAPWIAAAYGNDKVVAVVRVSALSLPLSALATVPKALMRRNMEFRSLFWINSSFLISQAIASVGLAAIGLGYWALIWGQLVGFVIAAMLTWVFCRWRPVFVMDSGVLRSILRFSSWVLASGFQDWMFQYMDNAIAGLFLGIHDLGIYALGFNVAIIIPGFLEASLGDVAYPAFCKLQSDPKDVGRNLVTLQELAATVMFPVSFGIAAVAPSAVHLLYGDKWDGLGTVICLLSIMPGLSYMWTLNEKAYVAIGRPDVWMKIQALTLFALLPLLWIAAPYGLFIFSIARFAGALLLPAANMLFGVRLLGIDNRSQLRTLVPALGISVVMCAAVFGLTAAVAPLEGLLGWAKLLSVIATGAMIYLVLLWQTNRQLWNRLILNLQRVVS